jgi:hypothetical protein
LPQFRSAIRRRYWFGVLYSTAFDYAVLFIGALFFNDTLSASAVVAAVILVGIWVFQLAYGLVGAAKEALLFFASEKQRRVEDTVDQMLAANMPRPMRFYADVDEYLVEVVKSPTSGADARLLAGASLGTLETLRTTQRPLLTMFVTMVLEEAIKRYGKKVGFVWDDGTLIEDGDLQ